MQKIIYIIDPETRELLGIANAPLDPVNTERAGKPVYAEVNTDHATDIKPPDHNSDADDLRWLGDKHGWQVDKGAKTKRKEDEALAAKDAAEKDKAEQLKKQLAAMTDTERKLHAMREEDPAAFDADEQEESLQEREAKALARLERHEKRRDKRREKLQAEQAEKDAALVKEKPETANNNSTKK